MPNSVRFLRLDQNDIQLEEIEAFEKIVNLTRLKFTHSDVTDEESLIQSLRTTGCKYLIIAGHGNEIGIGTKDEAFTISWERAGEIICDSGCFNLVVDAKIILYCCKGGLVDASCKLMNACPNLEFTIGPVEEHNSTDLFGVFSNFFFNLEINSNPLSGNEAIHRAQESTGITIDHFSRTDYNELNGEHVCERCEEYRIQQGLI